MKMKLLTVLTLFVSTLLYGQQIDTLSFFSRAFEQERTVYIQTPEFYKYQSDSVKLPVIYILDGQHEWFVNPLLSSIRYLQYTHEIPQALLVIIPLTNRNAECGIESLDGTPSPLHKFITEEVDIQLRSYNPGGYKMIIGHSFSASFALYSYLKAPNFYSAVISNTPMDHFEEMILEFGKSVRSNDNISISVGSIAMDKDYYHRREYDRLKLKYPDFFQAIHTFEANHAAHNAVPIVATPYLLTEAFARFRSRYSKIAEVNDEYVLIKSPDSPEEEIRKIENASRIGNFRYVAEIPEINGMASRYLTTDEIQYGIMSYEMGVKYYPEYYEFHLALYELYLPADPVKSKYHLNKGAELIKSLEPDLPENRELLQEISNEKVNNGW
jgi:predicted alpha/beta superfamily hydrolase